MNIEFIKKNIKSYFLFKDISLQLISILISGLSSFLLFIILARFLEVSEFGKFSYFFAIGYTISIILDFGGKINVLKEISKSNNKKNKNKIFSISITNIFLISLLLYISTFIIFNNIIFLSTIFCFSTICFLQICYSLLKAESKFLNELYYNLINRFCIITIIIIFLYNKPINSKDIFCIIGTINIIFFFVIVFFEKINLKFNFNKKIFIYLKYIFLIDLITSIYFRYQVVLLEYFDYGFIKIAEYSAAFRLVEFFVLALSPIGILVLKFSTKNLNKIFFHKICYFLIFIIGGISFSTGLILYNFSNFITQILFTEQFINTSYYLKSFGLILIPVGINIILSNILLGMGYFKFYVLTIFFTFIINFMLNYFSLEQQDINIIIFNYFLSEIFFLLICWSRIFLIKNEK
jgi:O-antigen/teichoic acid export membrane protein